MIIDTFSQKSQENDWCLRSIPSHPNSQHLQNIIDDTVKPLSTIFSSQRQAKNLHTSSETRYGGIFLSSTRATIMTAISNYQDSALKPN